MDEHEVVMSCNNLVCYSCQGVIVSEGRALQILSAGGDAGSRAAAKGLNVNGTGDGTVSGDGRDPHKREYKRKQLLVAKDKDKEAGVLVSVYGGMKTAVFVFVQGL